MVYILKKDKSKLVISLFLAMLFCFQQIQAKNKSIPSRVEKQSTQTTLLEIKKTSKKKKWVSVIVCGGIVILCLAIASKRCSQSTGNNQKSFLSKSSFPQNDQYLNNAALYTTKYVETPGSWGAEEHSKQLDMAIEKWDLPISVNEIIEIENEESDLKQEEL